MMNRCVMSAALVAFAAGCETSRETFTDPSMPIEMARGSEFDIALDANHSTGFEWVLADSDALGPLRQVRRGYSIPRQNRGRNGAGGTERWTFATPRPGHGVVTLVYKRPSETRPATDSAQFRVRVR
jgi:predicted secreted protein